MDYAIISTGGKQYKVNPGQTIEIESLGSEADSKVTFDRVLMVVEGGKVNLGTPLLNDYVVSGKVIANEKGEKIRVAKFRAKSRHRRVSGHRQLITKVEITGIEAAKSKTVKSNA